MADVIGLSDVSTPDTGNASKLKTGGINRRYNMPSRIECDKYKGKKSSISVRQINCPTELLNTKNLNEVHNVVYDKKYDFYLKDLIDAIQRKDRDPQKKDRFWCSALLGYIYTNCGILNKGTDWSILRPSDFTPEGETGLTFNENISLGPMIQLSP